MLSLGGKGEISKGHATTVKVVLAPIGVDGEPFEVAAAPDQRPDGPERGRAPGSGEGSSGGGIGSVGAYGGRPGG